MHLQTLLTHLLMPQVSLMRSWDKTSLPYSLVCRTHTRTHCLINPSELLLSQAAPPCGMVVFSFLSSLWKRMVFLLLSKDGPEAMYIVIFKQDLFLDELYCSLRQGFGGSAPHPTYPLPKKMLGAACQLWTLEKARDK